MSVKHFGETNFEQGVVLVEFFAEWCGPCRQLLPVIEELEKEYEGKIEIGKVDIDQDPQLAGKYGVMSVPTVVLFKEGEEVGRKVGAGSKEEYEKMIKKFLSNGGARGA